MSVKSTKIFTNHVMITGADEKAIIKASALITSTYYDPSDVKRMSFFNTDAQDIDNTNNEYFYDEIYAVLSETVKRTASDAKQPAMLCQLVTNHELTLDDLLTIQANAKNTPLTIINRWHMKYILEWPDGEKNNHMLEHHTIMGYLSVINGRVSKHHRIEYDIDELFENGELKQSKIGDYPEDKGRLDFIQDMGIEVLMRCPRCGERTPAPDIHFQGYCDDCTPRGLAFRGRLVNTLEEANTNTD